jgi:hypothetical protein
MSQAADPVRLTIPDYVRPDAGPINPDDAQVILTHLITEARDFIDGEVSPARAEATELYHAKALPGDEKLVGRSTVKVTTVRDTVRGAKPDILRVVLGAERPVAIEAWKPGTEAAAEQATDFLRLTIEQDNEGERVFSDVIDDGLIRKLGVVKWWWDEGGAPTSTRQRLTTEQLAMLQAQEPDFALVSVRETETPGLLDVEYRTGRPRGVARFAAVPGNEFLFDREARSIAEATFIAHRCEKTRGELIAMGIKPEVIDAHGGTTTDETSNAEVQARNPAAEASGNDSGTAGTASTKHLYIEAYPFLDADGDGVAELRRVICIGPSYHIVENEPCDTRPFAAWTPVPEAHQLLGGSYTDLVGDMQKAETSVLRASLDSLAASIFPRTVYKDGDANVKDILNTAIGAPIRTRSGPQAVQSFSHNFVGKESLPFLAFFRELTERRTGLSNGAQGLDADALQSSTADAVDAAVQGAKAQAEMTARLFLLGVLKPLLRGLYRLYIKHQPAERMVRVRGRWVPVNPSTWDAEAEVRVLVPLGAGLVAQRLETLVMVAEKQEMILQQMGMTNPFVKPSQYHETLAQILKLRGFVTPEQFFTRPDDAAIEAAERAAAENAPADPTAAALMAQVEVEKQKAQHQAQLKELEFQRESQMKQMEIAFEQEKLRLEQQKAEAQMRLEELKVRLEDDRQRDKQAADITLKERELELKHQRELEDIKLSADIARQRATTQAGPSEG